MKDSIALLIAGAVAAGLSWAFWHYAGQDAFWVFSTVVIVALWLDNMRLRREARVKRTPGP